MSTKEYLDLHSLVTVDGHQNTLVIVSKQPFSMYITYDMNGNRLTCSHISPHRHGGGVLFGPGQGPHVAGSWRRSVQSDVRLGEGTERGQEGNVDCSDLP